MIHIIVYHAPLNPLRNVLNNLSGRRSTEGFIIYRYHKMGTKFSQQTANDGEYSICSLTFAYISFVIQNV